MENFIDNIRESILRNKKPSYQTTNKKEIRIRCPYCGDSRSNLSSAHLYIEMQPPFRFHCFKCETSGVLNNQTLRDFEILDSTLNTSIINANKDYRNNKGVQKISLFKNKTLKNTVVNSEITNNSINYISRRFLVNFDSVQELADKFRIVLDPIYFLNENNIYLPKNRFDFSRAIGFISADNSHVIFRDISGEQETRYYNFNMFPDDENISSKAYNIRSQVNIMKEKVNLVMTEGIFDIIGVYLHFYKNTPEENNTIFAAACGKAFNAVILKYIRLGFLDLNITIYSDADVDIAFYKNLKQTSEYLKNSRITIFYNSLYDPKTKFGKDYGVPKEQIKLKKIII